jgi:hypothetical protein
MILTKQIDLHAWADCVDGFIQIVQQTNQMLIVPMGAIVGQVQLVQENAAIGSIDNIGLVNNLVDVNTC